MRFMERRGSGLRKIVSETEKLPGYTEALRPEFHATAADFRVVLWNVNGVMRRSAKIRNMSVPMDKNPPGSTARRLAALGCFRVFISHIRRNM